MMSIDATIANMLIMIKNVLNKTICFKDIIMSKISINHNTMIQEHFL